MNLFSFKFLKSAQAILIPAVSVPQAPVRQQVSQARPTRPLRVLCVRDPKGSGQPNHHTGRLVISGRMADVCAELDRMVQAQSLRQGLAPQPQLH